MGGRLRYDTRCCPVSPMAPRRGGRPLAFQGTSVPEGVGSVLVMCQGAMHKMEAAVLAALTGESAKYLFAGAIAGIVSRTFVSPLEVVATVNMCSSGRVGGPVEELRRLFLKEGLKGFFRGNLANCLKVAPTKGIQFLTFELFKGLITEFRRRQGRPDSEPLHPLERLAAGGAAGMAAAVLCYPLEVAKTLLTTHPEQYKGVFNTIATVARQQGVRNLYRGLAPTLVAMFPYVGLEFMLYEQMKLRYEKWLNKDNTPPHIFVLLCIGAVAGASSLTVCHPLDVVRKRMQLQGVGGRPIQYRSFLDAMMRISREEGAPALYRGLSPTYLSVFPSAGMSYVIYEATKSALGLSSIS